MLRKAYLICNFWGGNISLFKYLRVSSGLFVIQFCI
jgi:hypothetical protein